MWWRASSHVQALAPWRSRALCRLRLRPGGETLSNRALPASARLFSSESDEGELKKKVEDIMPIATGLEREELEGKKRFDVDPPLRAVGTKVAPLGSIFLQGLKYSTVGDFDTHEDFQPTSKIERTGVSLQDVVRQDVEKNPVVIFMKGIPEAPRCGFSALAVKVLQQYNVPITARNILENPQLKEGVKAFSNWPTFPQVFIKGEFVGGSDILLNMHQTGQLKEVLVDISTDSCKAP